MTKAIKKRNPVIALLLSLLVPGLGQLYSGKAKRAGVLYGVGLGVSLLFFLLFYRWFYGLVGYLGFLIFYYLFSAGDAFFVSRRESEVELLRFQRWYWYCSAVLLHLVVLGLMLFVVSPLKAYRVPTNSMVPTLVPGDYFLVDKRYYEGRSPERGDVVVFTLPENRRVHFVKRVVGLSGEVIETVTNTVYIGKTVLDEPYLDPEAVKYTQSLLRRPSFGPYRIPEKTVFVMGDNRNHSYDSRNFREVPYSDLAGKVLYLVWSKRFYSSVSESADLN